MQSGEADLDTAVLIVAALAPAAAAGCAAAVAAIGAPHDALPAGVHSPPAAAAPVPSASVTAAAA